MIKHGLRTSEFARSVARIAEVVDAAALAPDRWQDVCTAFQALLPEGRVLLQGYDRSLGSSMPLAGAGWEDVNLDPYYRHFAALNPWVESWVKMPVQRTTSADAVLPRSMLERTEFFNDWLKPMGGADFASGIKIAQDADRLAFFCVHYGSSRGEEKHDRVAAVMQAVAPRLRRALDCNRVVLRRHRSHFGEGVMHSLLDPALIVDPSCKLLAANDAAEALIGTGMFLSIRSRDIVSFGLSPIDELMTQAVSRTCSRAPGSSGHNDFVFEKGGVRFSISVLPIAQNIQSLAMKGPLPLFHSGIAALVVIRTLEPIIDSTTFLRERYGLTEKEAQLVSALCVGGSLVKIADELGIAYETARFRLKSIFAKTNTHNQRELLGIALRKASQ